jgi:endonuclease YncB( thermonuclease family)
MIRFLLICLTILYTGDVYADSLFARLDEVGTARIVKIIDGDTVMIDPPVNGANEVRLVGIQAPKIPLGRKNFIAWPLGDESKSALSAIALNQTVRLYARGQKMDRHGRHLAHLQTTDGVWIQGRMLEIGLARVYSFPDNRSLIDEMLAIERQARQGQLGIWSHAFYKIRNPIEAAALIGRFEVVEGTVRDVAKVKKRIYLNFGDDWRTDFTLSIEKKFWKLFSVDEQDIMSLEGKMIRVRGWLKEWNGPSIKLTHPEQIEIITD